MFNAQEISKNVISAVMSHAQWKMLNQLWFFMPKLPEKPHPLEQSPIKEQIETLTAIANGEIDREIASEGFVGEALEMCQSLIETLYSTPMEYSYSIPNKFWDTPVGQIVAHTQVWAKRDTLITITEAAKILRGNTDHKNIAYIGSLIQQGKLLRYVDPKETNPQKAGRVSLQSVKSLAEK